MNIQTLKKWLTVENLLIVCVVLTEALRVYPLLVFFGEFSIPGWTKTPLSLLSALAIIGITTVIVSITLKRGLHVNESRLATLTIGILLILVLTRLENGGGYALWDMAWFGYAGGRIYALISAFIFGLYFLWRGIAIAREDLSTDYLYKHFAIGIVGFIILTPLWAAALGLSAGNILFTKLLPYVLAYFSAGLMGLGLANFLSLRSGMGARPKASDLFTRRWLLVLIGIVLAIVGVSTIVASSLSVNLISFVIQPLNVAAGWLARGFLWVLGYPLGILAAGAYWLIGVIIAWIQRTLIRTAAEAPQIDITDIGEQVQSAQVPPELFAVIKWLLVVAAIAVIVFFLSRALYRYWRGPKETGYEEIHESLWGGFGADLKSFLKGLADRFRRNALHGTPPRAATITNADQIISVRELYCGLLWVGAESGHPKATAQTPYEYQHALREVVATEQESLAAITGAYVRERYGHIQISREEVLVLVRRWFSLRSVLRAVQANTSTQG